jgi:bifunctional glutamyl/prolyl-tRNA synthetase
VQGNKVRDLKTSKADKSAIDAEVKSLLSLKAEYKTITGTDWKPNAAPEVQKSTSEVFIIRFSLINKKCN